MSDWHDDRNNREGEVHVRLKEGEKERAKSNRNFRYESSRQVNEFPLFLNAKSVYIGEGSN